MASYRIPVEDSITEKQVLSSRKWPANSGTTTGTPDSRSSSLLTSLSSADFHGKISNRKSSAKAGGFQNF
jgi:hypothetical protein